jgi:hypothetical protein
MQVAIVGGGVAGLSCAWHLIELLKASKKPFPLTIELFTMLAPTGGEGNGLGGKAMSRSFEGRYDTAHNNMDRIPFYGPMMPYKGTIPHGYHVFWQYPNLRRMLGDTGDGMGLLVPAPTADTPGGAALIASFQGLINDPAPGGPGIARVGLVDPDYPASCQNDVSHALFRLKENPFLRPVIELLTRIFEDISGLDPLVFTDLLYCQEIDLELRLALIGASLAARRINPETATVWVDGKKLPLNEVEYDVWTRELLTGWAGQLLDRLDELALELKGFKAMTALLEVRADAATPAAKLLSALIPDTIEDDVLLVVRETDRVLRGLPGALKNLVTGDYPVWKSLHMRFGPDATFASPYSFDAAAAVRSIAFCFLTPAAGRAWSPDGGKVHRIWGRMWERLKTEAASAGATLNIHEGRVVSVEEQGSEVALKAVLGHAGHGGYASELGMPHAPDRRFKSPIPAGTTDFSADACVLAIPSGLCEGVSQGGLSTQLEPLREKTSETMELLIWTRSPLGWSKAAAASLKQSCITGMEGPFCLLADYRSGLWSPQALQEENPFGDGNFSGSILESCGGFEDLYACPTREDAYGWPEWIKEAIYQLLSKKDYFEELDSRPWNLDSQSWYQKRSSGSWSEAHMDDPASLEDWFIASRWLAFGFLRQLSQIQSLGPQAVCQLASLTALLEPRQKTRAELLSPPAALTQEIRYVVMRSTKTRNRIFCPGLGDWHNRPISGLPFDGHSRLYPAGDWTRNGLDVVCMEGACLSGMRAARGLFADQGHPISSKAPRPIPVLPQASWYSGLDPLKRE